MLIMLKIFTLISSIDILVLNVMLLSYEVKKELDNRCTAKKKVIS